MICNEGMLATPSNCCAARSVWNGKDGSACIKKTKMRPGIRIALPPSFKIAVGWNTDLDLDAGVLSFDKDVKLVGHVNWRRTSDFSGAIRLDQDDTSGSGDEDDETLSLDMRGVKAERSAMVINVYYGTLSYDNHAYLRIFAQDRASPRCPRLNAPMFSARLRYAL